MSGVTKHVRVKSEEVKDASLATVDLADAAVTEPKFSEHLEHGRLGSVTSGGTYIHFTTAFGAAPNVVVTGVNEAIGTVATLAAEPTVGSAKVEVTAPGTVVMNYVAWGARA